MSVSSEPIRALLCGAIEFQLEGAWHEGVDVGVFFQRDYDLFGLLFGISNFAGFDPLFADRGLPADVSCTVRERFQADCFGASWASFDELCQIDWSVSASRVDSFFSVYEGAQLVEKRPCFEGGPDRLSARAGSKTRTYERKVVTATEARETTSFDTVLRLAAVLNEDFEASRLVVFFEY